MIVSLTADDQGRQSENDHKWLIMLMRGCDGDGVTGCSRALRDNEKILGQEIRQYTYTGRVLASAG